MENHLSPEEVKKFLGTCDRVRAGDEKVNCSATFLLSTCMPVIEYGQDVERGGGGGGGRIKPCRYYTHTQTSTHTHTHTHTHTLTHTQLRTQEIHVSCRRIRKQTLLY